MRQGESLSDSVQVLSEELSRRLIVLDAHLRVVSYSIHETDDDRRLLSTVLAHSDSWPPPTIDGRGVGIAELPDLGPGLFVALRDHRYRVGYLLTVVRTPAPGADDLVPAAELDLMLDRAPALGVQLSLRGLYAERDQTRVASLLDDLVGDDPQRRAGAAEVLVGEDLLGSARHYSSVALGGEPRPSASQRAGQRSGHGAEEANESGRTALAVYTTLDFVRQASTASVVGATLPDATGIIVFPRTVVVPRLERILRRPEINTVRAGVGSTVPSLTEVHRSFTFARRALRANWLAPDAHPVVTEWESCGLDGLLALLPLETITADDLPSAVRHLLSCDLGPDLHRTIDAYLATGGDAAMTATELRIHRSTLYYRLDRLREVHGVDLTHGPTRIDLQLGLRVARLAGLLGPH